MISGLENLEALFSTFGEGAIAGAEYRGDVLHLQVVVSYLVKERTHTSHRQFDLALHDIQSLQLTTWAVPYQSLPEVFTRIDEMFQARLYMVDCRIVDDQLEIDCNQFDNEYDYMGGTLRIAAEGAVVTDERGWVYSLDQLTALSKAYWVE